MIPDHYMHLSRFPLMPSGKIDRYVLPKPDPYSRAVAGHVPPRSRKERLICEAFGRVLGLERVGIGDDFFMAGGSSLSAIRLAMELQKDFKVKTAELFTQRTPEKLAEALTFSSSGLQ